MNEAVPNGVPTTDITIDIWRQFIFSDGTTGDATVFGLPKIVANVPATQGSVVDSDPALTGSAAH